MIPNKSIISYYTTSLINYLLAVILCLLSYTATGNPTINKQPKARVESYYIKVDKLIEEYDVPEKSLNLAEELVKKGLDYSELIDWREGELAGLVRLGIIEIRRRNFEKAFRYNLRVLYSDYTISITDQQLLFESMGYCLGGLGMEDESIEYHKKLLRILSKDSYFKRYKCYDNIASQYLQLRKYKAANYYSSLAINSAKKTTNTYLIMRSYNNAGWGQFVQNKISSSFELYQNGITVFEKKENHNWNERILYAMLYRNNAIAYMKLNKNNEALHHILKSTLLFDQLQSNAFITRNELLTVEIYLNSNHSVEAINILKKLDKTPKTESDLLHYQQLTTNYFELFGSLEKAVASQKDQMKTQKRMFLNTTKVINKHLKELTRLKEHNAQQQLLLNRQLQQVEDRSNKLRISLLIVSVIMVLIIGVFLVLKYRADILKKERVMSNESQLNIERLKIKELEEQRLMQELELKNQDLTSFAFEISRKHEFLDEVKNQLTNIKQRIGDNADLINPLIQFIKNNSIIDDKFRFFQQNVDQVNFEFMQLLEHRFPELSKGDRQLCALLRLQLSTKEIAIIKNISAESVKSLRYRLRKKLGLDHSIDLNSFFSNLR